MATPSITRSASLTPAFTGTTIDRASELRADRAEVRRLLKHPRAAVLGASADSVLVADGSQPQLLRRPLGAHVSPYQPILLGLEHDTPLFAADLDDPEAANQLAETGAGRLVSLREAGSVLGQEEGGLAAYLVALLNWHRRHRFCANCGAATRVAEAGLSRRCPNCRATHFPRTDPVVIMLVDDGDANVLLGRRIGWAEGRFSILAGYVAPGETPEEAVAREVHEESGVVVHSPRYITSQPWPFPASLMLGYEASSQRNAADADPVPQEREMVEVRWFSLGQVREAAGRAHPDGSAGQGDCGLQLPGEVSIARILIDAWVARGGRRLGP
ncbi:MAG: NAD(+) diphosphatase [Solirubrobacteraceae bacterium]